MGPTNIRLIGLGTSSKPINSALLTHLPYIQSTHGKSHCEIFTRYSLSAKIVKRAVEQSNLSDSIKTHEAPEDLANDPDLELVVCVADVESHYDLLLLAIGTGMSVYTGLPIALNMKQMQELIDSAEKNGIRTVFESQGQAHPAAHLIKKMIAKNKIGKPLSITLIATTGLPLDRPLPVGFKMLAERKAGGNFATIWCSHNFGELESANGIMGINHPTLDLMDPSRGSEILETIIKGCPDNIHLSLRASKDCVRD